MQWWPSAKLTCEASTLTFNHVAGLLETCNGPEAAAEAACRCSTPTVSLEGVPAEEKLPAAALSRSQGVPDAGSKLTRLAVAASVQQCMHGAMQLYSRQMGTSHWNIGSQQAPAQLEQGHAWLTGTTHSKGLEALTGKSFCFQAHACPHCPSSITGSFYRCKLQSACGSADKASCSCGGQPWPARLCTGSNVLTGQPSAIRLPSVCKRECLACCC